MTAETPEGDGLNRAMITGSIMLATIMNTLDTTIANVALPHIQGSVSASASQITWVLTSYIVAAAIMTPLTGWVAGRFGRKQVFLVSVAGFTLASALCGMAESLGQIVAFRLLQGLFGAALIPLSQAVLLDINPPEKHGQAMAVWGMGVLIGPILGPVLGGWLTDNYSWRWVFYVNVPFGILAFMGVLTFIHDHRHERKIPFDFLGFAFLSIAIMAFQLVLDRGETQDWFTSMEVCIEAAVGCVSVLLFLIHSLTAEHPFFSPAMFADRNLMTGLLFGVLTSVMLFSSQALLPPMMETLLGYPVLTTGMVSAPRGIASVISMMVVGQLIVRVDPRLLVAVGLALSAGAMWMMTGFSLQMNFWNLIWSGVMQGAGMSMLFVPISTMAFATLPVPLRTEGSALYNLVRNMGGSAGISITQVLLIRNADAVHSRLVENLRPDNPMAQAPYLRAPFSLSDPAGIAALNAEVTRQAMMVSYIDIFWLMAILAVAFTPFLLLLRRPVHAKANEPHLIAD